MSGMWCSRNARKRRSAMVVSVLVVSSPSAETCTTRLTSSPRCHGMLWFLLNAVPGQDVVKINNVCQWVRPRVKACFTHRALLRQVANIEAEELTCIKDECRRAVHRRVDAGVQVEGFRNQKLRKGPGGLHRE